MNAARTLKLLLLIVSIACVGRGEERWSYSTHWFGKQTVVELVEAAFATESAWEPSSGMPPPLHAQDAVRLAKDYIATNKVDSLTYVETEISLIRFATTNKWFYQITFEATDSSWRDSEPYRSMVRTGEYEKKVGNPELRVYVLMSGAIQENALMKRKRPTMPSSVPLTRGTLPAGQEPRLGSRSAHG